MARRAVRVPRNMARGRCGCRAAWRGGRCGRPPGHGQAGWAGAAGPRGGRV